LLSGDGGWLCDDVGAGLPSSFGFPIAVHPHDPMYMPFSLMVRLGPAAAALGIFVQSNHPVFPAAVMAFAPGGLVCLLF
jgi:hypothetical protein